MGQLLEQREIIENPEGPAVSGGDQLALPSIDREVAYLHMRQVQAERPPVRATVEAGVDGLRGAEKQERCIARILSHDEDGPVIRQALGQNGPMPAEVRGLEREGPMVVPHVALRGQVSRARGKMRRLDRGDLRPLRQLWRCYLLPVLSAVNS